MKKNKTAHTANTKKGSGDNYGTGLRQPVGKIIEVMAIDVPGKRNTGKPPKKLA